MKDLTVDNEVIAVMMPNCLTTCTSKTDDYMKYRTTIKNIEARTGYSLLRAVPEAVRSVIEVK